MTESWTEAPPACVLFWERERIQYRKTVYAGGAEKAQRMVLGFQNVILASLCHDVS